MFLRRNWLPLSIFTIAIAVVCVYLLQPDTPKAPIKRYKTVGTTRPATLKPPPPGETAESGHWHGDEWHAEPHTPQVTNSDTVAQTPVADTEVQDAQVAAPMQESSAHTQESGKAVYGPDEFAEWFEKDMELLDQLMQVEQKRQALLAPSAEFFERLRTDKQLRSEVKPKLDKINAEAAELYRKYEEHQQNNPLGDNSGNTLQRN